VALTVVFSRRLAVLAGMGLPVLEVVRRWRTLPGPPDTWHHWLDDFFLGAMLLGAAWLSRPRAPGMRPRRVRRLAWLTAAWSFACGVGLFSLLSQVEHLLHPELGDDPSGIAHGWIVLAKAVLLAVGVAGLVASMGEE